MVAYSASTSMCYVIVMSLEKVFLICLLMILNLWLHSAFPLIHELPISQANQWKKGGAEHGINFYNPNGNILIHLFLSTMLLNHVCFLILCVQ